MQWFRGGSIAGIVCRIGLAAGVESESPCVGRIIPPLWPHRPADMAIVDMTLRTLMRSTPYPDIEKAAVQGVMETATTAAAGFSGKWDFAKMDRGAEHRKHRGAQENGEFIFIVDIFIHRVGGDHVPSIAIFHQRFMFQRACRVLPGEGEVSEFTIMNSADFNTRFMGSSEIAALSGEDGRKLRLHPGWV